MLARVLTLVVKSATQNLGKKIVAGGLTKTSVRSHPMSAILIIDAHFVVHGTMAFITAGKG